MSAATPSKDKPTAPQSVPAPTANGSFAGKVSRYVDNHINPIVTKELRQAVRSTFIQTILSLFLVVQLGMMAMYLLFNNENYVDPHAGRNVFVVLQVMLLVTVILLVPLYVGVRFAAERTGANVDLLFISTLKPRQIIGGKLLSGVIVAVLVGSVTAPFMTLTYLLRGIDLPSIFIILALDVLLTLAAIQLAIFTGSLRMGPLVMGLAGLLSMGALGPLFGLGVGTAVEVIQRGGGSYFDTWDFWVGAGLIVLGILGGVGLLFSMSVAAITAPAANRALAPRVYLTVFWLVSLVVVIGTSLGSRAFTSRDIIRGWIVISVLVFNFALLISSGERESLGPRLRRDIPRNPGTRALAFLFYSGSAGGITWSVIMTALSILVSIATNVDTSYYDRSLLLSRSLIEMSMLVFCYVMSAVLFRRWLLRSVAPTHAIPTIAISMAAAGCLLPMLIVYFIDGPRGLDGARGWLVINPFAALLQMDNSQWQLAGPRLIVCLLWMLAFSVPAALWGLEQWRKFSRHELTPAEQRREQLRTMNAAASNGGPAIVPTDGAVPAASAGTQAPIPAIKSEA